jgi:hypothetical protein
MSMEKRYFTFDLSSLPSASLTLWTAMTSTAAVMLCAQQKSSLFEHALRDALKNDALVLVCSSLPLAPPDDCTIVGPPKQLLAFSR